MQQLCFLSIKTRDYQTLTEILLKFPYLHQLALHLTTQQFSELIENINYTGLKKNQSYILKNNNIYFFGQDGEIVKKQYQIKEQKYVKQVKERSRANSKWNRQYKENNLIQIKQFNTHLQNTIPYKSQSSYYIVGCKKGFALSLKIEELKQPLFQKINQFNQEKLKYLAQTFLLSHVQKSVLQNYLFKFDFLQIKFDQILYGCEIRSQKTFFLLKGSIEIGSRKEGIKHCIVEGVGLLGLSKTSNEIARCISEQSLCYMIDTALLQNILQRKYKESDFKIIPIKNQLRVRQNNIFTTDHLSGTSTTTLQTFRQIRHVDKLGLTRKKILQKSIISTRQLKQQKQKKAKVRRHFSNFYNEAYTEFSEKKLKQLNIRQEEDLNIFKMKIIEPKAPNMSLINSQLKKMRILKLKKCKENLIKSRGQEKQLLINELENQKYSVCISPRRNIKRELLKTSCVSFNKYCSLHV